MKNKAMTTAFGIVLTLALAGCNAEESDYGSTGSQDGTGAGTSFYDGGSITTTDDGELLYSDTSGTSFSSDG
jgi:uncharacterized lipoprotein YehR (DUF1307 family)